MVEKIASVGKRKLFYAVFSLLVASLLAWMGKIDGSQWQAYSVTVAVAYMGANAVGKFANGGGK